MHPINFGFTYEMVMERQREAWRTVWVAEKQSVWVQAEAKILIEMADKEMMQWLVIKEIKRKQHKEQRE